MKTIPNTKPRTRLWAALSAGLLLGAGIMNSSAAFRTWTGGGNPDFNWSNPANWGGTAPVSTDDLIFSGSIGLNNTNDLAIGTSYKSITIFDGAGAFVMGGNSVRLSAGFTNRSDFVQTMLMSVENNTSVTYNMLSNSVVFARGPWNNNWRKAGPFDVICLQMTNVFNGQIAGVREGRVILNGQVNGVCNQGVQIDTGGTVVVVGPANQMGDTDTRCDVTLTGGLLQIQQTNALGVPTFEAIPMLRGSNTLAVVENGSALGPIQLRVGGGTGVRIGAYDGIIRDGSGGGALSLQVQNSGTTSYLRLNGTNNTYTGETIVTNGSASAGYTRLLVDGRHVGGGKYSVEGKLSGNYSVLGGAGTISASSVAVNVNGIIAPGGTLGGGVVLYNRQGGAGSGSGANNTGTFAESTAALTISNSVTLSDATSTLDIHLNGTNTGAYDQLIVAGNGTFTNNNANLQLTLDLGYLPNAGDKFTIVDVAGTNSGGNVGVFASLNGVATFLGQNTIVSISGIPFKISYRAEGDTFDMGSTNGNNIMLEVQADTSTKLTWRGDLGSDWDVVNLLNWRDTNNIATTFTNLDKVTFDNTGLSTNVNLTTGVNPLTLLVSATNDYFFTGPGKLTGVVILTKTNSGKLVITTENDFAGSTTIQGGTIQVGDGGTVGALPGSVALLSGGVLDYNRGDAQNLGTVTGAGNLIHSGSGTLTVTNNLAALTGTISNLAGTLQIGNGTVDGNIAKVGGMVDVATGSSISHLYTGASDFTVNNSMRGAGSATFEFNTGGARTLTFGAGVVNTNFTGTTTIKPFMRFNVSSPAMAPAGPIVVESIGAPGYSAYYSHPGSTITNFNSITLAGTGPASPVDNPRGKGALRLGNVWAGPVILSADATIGGDGTGTVIGNINDNGNNFTLEYFGGTIAVGPATGTNAYGATLINEDYNGSFTSPILTTVRALNANAFGQGVINMKGRARLELNGNNVSVANLVDVTTSTPNGTSFAPVVANNSSTADAVLTVGLDGVTPATFIGTFINGSSKSMGLTKAGAASYSISGDSTSTGPITVAAGTLSLVAASGSYPDATAVTGSGSFSNAVLFAVNSGATLDVVGRTDGTLTLNANQTLKGSGTVSGNVVGGVGSVINPGDDIGSITLSGNVTLLGTLLMELNRTNAPATNDTISIGGTLTAGGTLLVTNRGPVLQAGDSFQLFNTGVSGFSYALQTADVANNVAYTWTNTVSTDGKITLLSVSTLVNTNSTNITTSVSGSDLTLEWPTDHIGWTLQTQTNTLNVGLSGNWSDVTGSALTNKVIIPMDAANGSVFFRMVFTNTP